MKNASNGEAYASFAVGIHFRKGLEGVLQDDSKARQWWEKAARQGHALAAYNLGFMHLKGIGGKADPIKAFVFLTLAKEQWVPEATELLSQLESKLNAEKIQRAKEILESERFQRAQADSGTSRGNDLVELAVRHLHGKGTAKNPQKALEVFLQAARQNHLSAQFSAGFLLEKQNRISGHEGALYWYEKAAEKGDARAQYRLGAIYFRGGEIPKDMALSYAWTRLAAEQELPSAKTALEYLETKITKEDQNLGRTLSDGGALAVIRAPMSPIPIPQRSLPTLPAAQLKIPSPHSLHPNHPLYSDFQITFQDQEPMSSDQAGKWAQSAASGGNIQAQVLLAERYHQGLGVTRDYDKAAYWYSKAAAKGDPHALSNLAYMQVRVGKSRDPQGRFTDSGSSSGSYAKAVAAQFGIHQKIDFKAAANFYREAVRAGRKEAMVNLALMLWHGLGSEPKLKEAQALLIQAQKQGSLLAKTLLSQFPSTASPSTVQPSGDSQPAKTEEMKPTKSITELAGEGNPKAQLELGTKLLEEKKEKEAQTWLEKALNQGEEGARAPLVKLITAKGNKAFASFQNKEAIEFFQQALALDSKSFEVLHGLSRAYDSRGQDLLSEEKRGEAESVIKTSLEMAEKLKEHHPQKGETWVMMAITTGNLAKFLGGKEKVKIGSKVEEYCKKAIETDPSQGMAYAVLATYYLAISELPWLLKAFAKSFLGGLPDVTKEDALELYRKGVKASPDLIYANFKLGQLLKKMGQKEDAKKYLGKAASLPPQKSQETRTRKTAQKLLGEL